MVASALETASLTVKAALTNETTPGPNSLSTMVSVAFVCSAMALPVTLKSDSSTVLLALVTRLSVMPTWKLLSAPSPSAQLRRPTAFV